jgi:hypothetical protein
MKIENKHTLVLIKRRYRDILLKGNLKNVLVRLKRLDYYYLHIIRTYD